MAVDFDFDTSYNNEEGEPDEDFEEEEGEEGEEPPRRNPLRLILLVLLILVLLCVVCFFGSRFLVPGDLLSSIPGLGGGTAPVPVPATDTPITQPTEEQPLLATEEPGPVEATEELAATMEPTEEAPPVATEEQLPATTEPEEETTVVIEPTLESTQEATAEPAETPTLVAEPTDETVGEHDEEPIAPTATTAPVPGPTATPTPSPTTGPTVVVTVTNCDNNVPPVADANGPYTAMQGKGQAIIIFDGSNSSDSDGTIVSYQWDFGDNSPPENGESVSHGYTSPGTYTATLTVTDDCNATGQDTAQVTITGATPPATGTPGTPTPTATPSTPPAGTMGFCYRVQYGDTLTGIAWRFGVPLPDLAYVNQVSTYYYVIAGQGIFVPVDQITQGPNVYEVQPDDTLNSVAFQCGLTRARLAQANGLDIDASLSPGQLLMIPPWIAR